MTMNSITKISMALLLSSGLVVAESKKYQKFDMQQGTVEYKITGSTSMMGVKSQTLGKKRVVFSEYGTKELRDRSF